MSNAQPLPPSAPPRRKAPRAPKRFTRAEVEEVFARFQARDPEPKGELESVNTFTLLVAVVLSAQATDAGVNKATRALFAIADTPAKMLALGEERVSDHIKTIGLYRTKAKNVIGLSRMLVEQHGGEVPDDRAALEALPGVGRKTANVVLNIAFGHPTIAVDTHIFRIGNRTGLAPGKTAAPSASSTTSAATRTRRWRSQIPPRPAPSSPSSSRKRGSTHPGTLPSEAPEITAEWIPGLRPG